MVTTFCFRASATQTAAKWTDICGACCRCGKGGGHERNISGDHLFLRQCSHVIYLYLIV